MADVENLFLRGKEAADRGNYEYAITLFIDVLRIAPNHRNTRIALRGCETELFRTRGAGAKAKLIGFLKGIVPFLMMLIQGGSPSKVMDQCEKYLRNDPTNITVLKKLGAACQKMGHLEAAADTLEFARQRSQRNVAVLRQLGEVHYALGAYDKAVRCYSEIVQIKPDDREATQRGKEISAESHLKRSHMEGSESYRDTLRDTEHTDKLLREDQIVRTVDQRTADIDRCKQAVEANPEDAVAHGALGDAHMKADQFAEAEGAYRKAFEVGKKFGMREKLGDARIRRLEKIERKAQEAAEGSGDDPHLLAKSREAHQRLLEFSAKEFGFRRQHHPTDMKLAFRLGQIHFELGGGDGVQQAIQQFQQAMSNTSLRVRAQFMLGRCFGLDPKTLDMAREQFQQAFENLESQTGELGKQIMYEIAGIDESLGKKDEALALYKKIFSVDAGFKDVGQKIQSLG